jgi:hypothetical protein
MFFHLLTALPISCSSLNVELLIAVCLCNHNHLTSIKLRSGELTGRNTNFIRGQYLNISSFTFFDLCAERLSSITKIFIISCHRIFYLLFLESQQTVYLSSFYNIVHASYHLIGHMLLQTHLTVLLSFEPSLTLPVPMTMTNHHESLLLLALSHLHIKVQNPKVCCILAVQCTFFQSVSWVIAFI